MAPPKKRRLRESLFVDVPPYHVFIPTTQEYEKEPCKGNAFYVYISLFGSKTSLQISKRITRFAVATLDKRVASTNPVSFQPFLDGLLCIFYLYDGCLFLVKR